MKKMKLLYLLLFLFWTQTPEPACAQDDVHFGTIFIEDVNYQNSGDTQKVNALTDSSSKQMQLETLYRKEVGLPNAELKKINSDGRSPASVKSKKQNDLTKKVGVLKNDELPRQIVYFLELRSFEGNTSKPIFKKAGQRSEFVLQMQPGELLKVTDTPAQYVHKLRMDRDNQGIWKKITTREEDLQDAQVYYDWRNFETITSHDVPVELDILVPYGKNSVPVYSRPGAWTWKDCGLTEELCLDKIDLHTNAYLFDSTIVDVKLSQNQNSDHRLFYKIGYQQKDKDGYIKHRVGWIPSNHAKRKISKLPKSLLATRNPSSFGTYESDEERFMRLQKYYVFQENMNSDNQQVSRWINSTPGQTSEVFFQNIALDGLVGFNSFHLEQSFLKSEFDQVGVGVGFGIFAPIFLDLEIQGTFMFTAPVSSNADEDPDFEDSFLFRGEQWLLYTTPISLSNTPLKFGVGGYYQTMFSGTDTFGFNSLVGFQFKGLFENPKFWTGVRYGPTGSDFSFRFENREIGFEMGYRLNPERKYESWTLFGDYSDTSYTSGQDNTTKFQVIQLGVRKQF